MESGVTGMGPVSGDEFVKAMTRIRRSFQRVKEAVGSGDLAGAEKAVRSLGRGLTKLEDLFSE